MPKCLVVGDRDLIQNVSSVLADTGAEVIVTENALEAILAPDAHEFDLVVVEIEMELMDGRELVERIAQLQPTIRALFMTAAPERYVINLANPHITIPKNADAVTIQFAVRHLLCAEATNTNISDKFRQIRDEVERMYQQMKKGGKINRLSLAVY